LGLHVERLSRRDEKTLLGLPRLPVTTILDVGANEGQFARYLLEYFPRATVHCYEPLPDAFAKLREWAQTDGRVSCENVAIGDQEGTAEIFRHIDHYYSSSLLPSTNEHLHICELSERQARQPIRITSLNELWKEKLPELGETVLVKLDVQGYE